MSTRELTNEEVEQALNERQAIAMGAEPIPEPPPDEAEDLHPMSVYARTFGTDKLTTVEVARQLGVSRELVRRWAREQRYPGIPQLRAPMGRSHMYLWTQADVDRLKELRRPRMVIDENAREPEREAS